MHEGCAHWVLSKDELHFRGGVILNIIATVTEHGTNQIETNNGKCEITDVAYRLDFSHTPRQFQPGLPYHGVLKVTDSVVPLQEEVIQICYNLAIRKTWNIKKNQQCSNFTVVGDSVNFYILPLKEIVVQIHLSVGIYIYIYV